MPKQHATRKSAHNVKMLDKAGIPPKGKAPQRTIRQAGGIRASVNRGGKKRVTG